MDMKICILRSIASLFIEILYVRRWR